MMRRIPEKIIWRYRTIFAACSVVRMVLLVDKVNCGEAQRGNSIFKALLFQFNY
jgi:hypothetical protein